MTELERITKAKDFYKENKGFFKWFLFFYKLVNHTVTKTIYIIVHVLMVIIFICFALESSGFYAFPKWTHPIAGWGFLACLLLLGFYKLLRRQQDEYYEYFEVSNLIGEMAAYMEGLSFYFWKGGRIRKIMKLIKKEKAKTIRDAAKLMKPKFRDKQMYADLLTFDEVSISAVDRQNKVISKRNAELAKKQEKEEAKELAKNIFWGAVGTAVVDSVLGSGTAESFAPINNDFAPPPASNNSGYDPEADKQKRKEADRQRLIQDYNNKADYWEREYYRLLKNDPHCWDDATKKAEYNKNYFRRLAREQG